jgi:Fe(3+) dicitrate transport protein
MNNLIYIAQSFSIGLSVIGMVISPLCWAQDAEGPLYDLGEFKVLGSKESVFEVPGSGFYLAQEEIDNFQYANIDQVLRQVPGVYFRGEDGYGLFPNISLRGVDSNRSGKVTMMEDGVLTAPAPYAAPSAYYSPTVGRMSSLEVLKGSSQLQYGPHTTGGVINYISTPIPDEKAGYMKLQYGGNNDMRLHAWTGGKQESDAGTFGYLAEVYARQTDGFKSIDRTAAYEGSDTGFDKTDTMVKLGWQPDSTQYHSFEFKLGYTDFHADETYLGLSTEDFEQDPYRRYAGSRFDEIDTNHTRTYLRHQTRWDNGSTLSTTAYYNDFHRNWYKLNKVDGKSLGTALFNGTELYEVLTGTRAGELRVKANNRNYFLGGVQTEFNGDYYLGEVHNELTAGLRLHRDQIRRFQWEDKYNMNDQGGLDEFILYGKSEPGGAGNRRQRVDSTSFYVKDKISIGSFAISPGFRYEDVDWEYFRADGRTTPDDDLGSYDVFAPGVTTEYSVDKKTRLFAGLNRGISLGSPGSARSGLDPEETDSFEAGVKAQSSGWYGEAVIFNTKFRNLIARESDAGGNPVGGDKNIGEITSKGLELLLSTSLHQDVSIQVPLTFAFTYTDAEFGDGTASGNADDSIFAGAMPGNELPYIPAIQWNLTTGIDAERWSFHLAATYVDDSHGDGSNLDLEEDASGKADARLGEIDSYFLIDLSYRFQLSETISLFASMQNALDEKWLASRIPHGPRPGAPRQTSVGIDWQF